MSWAYNPMLAVEVSEIGATLIALSVPGIKPLFDRCVLRKKSLSTTGLSATGTRGTALRNLSLRPGSHGHSKLTNVTSTGSDMERDLAAGDAVGRVEIERKIPVHWAERQQQRPGQQQRAEEDGAGEQQQRREQSLAEPTDRRARRSRDRSVGLHSHPRAAIHPGYAPD